MIYDKTITRLSEKQAVSFDKKQITWYVGNSLERKGCRMEQVRKHFIFTGRVQGVGFRYRASYVAQSIGLTGWVRNRTDGSVEMEVQGSKEQIYRMLSILNKDAYIRIDQIDTTDLSVKESEYGFHVRGY